MTTAMTTAVAQQQGDPGAQQLGRGLGQQAPSDEGVGPAVRVYRVRPAPAAAGWVNAWLEPVWRTIRVDPCPIEFRPTGPFGAYSAGSRDTNPDGRLHFSAAVIWTKPQFVRLYVHEVCHNLLDATECHHGHDAAFFALNHVLLQRLDRAGLATTVAALRHTNSLSFYDLQDAVPAHAGLPDHAWQPREISWALKTAHVFKDSDLSARELAQKISDLYFDFSDEVAAGPEKLKVEAEKKAAVEAHLVQKLGSLHESVQLWRGLSLLFFLAFSASVYLVARSV